VHTPLSCLEKPRRVLILGGGDGLAAREVLRYPEVEQVLLVDLDPAMTSLFRDHQFLNRLNQHSLSDKRLRILNADAFVWVSEPREAPFDAILVDFPDPSNYAVGKLYTKTFYQRLHPLLAPGGALSVQCTSPLFARRSYWCIVETIRAAGWQVSPYHLYVPSFGEWGFTLATREAPPHPEARRLPRDLRYLDAAALPDMFLFPADMAALPSPVNRLFDQVLVRYYEQDWRSIVDS
ncbi:MAG: polyamine aminopropyltransferase, partial [Candidatus Eremiobacteraeota bacterium]|nr:polyamine aminopropyltransferase [Candidatus Eremiobacteraeota bacterium]